MLVILIETIICSRHRAKIQVTYFWVRIESIDFPPIIPCVPYLLSVTETELWYPNLLLGEQRIFLSLYVDIVLPLDPILHHFLGRVRHSRDTPFFECSNHDSILVSIGFCHICLL